MEFDELTKDWENAKDADGWIQANPHKGNHAWYFGQLKKHDLVDDHVPKCCDATGEPPVVVTTMKGEKICF